MHYEATAHHFQQLIEQLSLSVDAIADIAGIAAEQVAEALVGEKKLFCCGVGIDASTATLMSTLLTCGVNRERPTLPAIELSTTTNQPDDGAIHWLTNRLGALGQPGDIAIIFASQLSTHSLEKLESTVNNRQCVAIWIGAQGRGPSLVFPGADPLITLSLCHASAACLAELIDIAMFGPLEISY